VLTADRTLARLRGAMEGAALWDDALLIVTSDHGMALRVEDTAVLGLPGSSVGKMTRQVPFLVKLPGQRTGFEYGEKFNTRVLRAIVEDVQSGGITSVDQLAARITALEGPLESQTPGE
jgi:membrane-anchored protein YejM (alkaline phosphatase superfamily)